MKHDQEYERQLLLQLFDFRSLFYAEEAMVRLMSEYFLRSHANLMNLHNQAYLGLRQQVTDVAAKWTERIGQMAFDGLRDEAFLDRVKRSAGYFAQTIDELLVKPIQLSADVKSNNKRAQSRLSNSLPVLRQQWYLHSTLLRRMADEGFSVEGYLKHRQMAMLEAADDQKLRRALKPQKPPKEKTTEVTLRLFNQGMTPVQIAAERGISPNTVFSHLSELVGAGKVDVAKVISPEHREAIERVVTKVGTDGGLNPIKTLCPPDVQWEEIRIVLASLN